MPAWTQAQLDALEAAIAEGATEISYNGKKVVYRSLEEMMRIRDVMRRALGLVDGRSTRVTPEFRNGLRDGDFCE